MFKKYNSIENVERKRYLDEAKIYYSDKEYVVSEKIHGSNFSFYIYDNDIKCAKRSGFIKEDEFFFNYEIILDRYKKNLRSLFNIIKKDYGNLNSIILYGEIYGGFYPHPDIEKKSVKKVQKGIYYSNDIEFSAFDIKINNNLVGYQSFKKYLAKVNIPMVPILFKGTLKDCINTSNEFLTLVPKTHALPDIKDNIAEGTIIKPIEPLYFKTGSRIIFKNKNDRFREITKSNKPKGERDKDNKDIVLPDGLREIFSDLCNYINENRLRNVLSKIGNITDKDFGKILGLFNKDILEDFSGDNEKFNILSKEDKKILQKSMNKKSSQILRKNFVNIIDGEF